MPLVLVTINRENPYINKHRIDRTLVLLLRQQVSRVLSCSDPGGGLVPDDIEIKIQDRDPKRDFGGKKYDLQIIVFANEFPARRKNLGERCVLLGHILERTYAGRGVHGYIWVRLAPASFAEF